MPQLAYLLLELADPLAQFLESAKLRRRLENLPVASGRIARHGGTCGNVANDSGLSDKNRVFADRQVVDEAALTSHENSLANHRASGNADLRRHRRILADVDVVRDVDEVVDLDASLDARLSQGCPVDRGIRTDLHIVLDDDDSHVTNPVELAVTPSEAESVRSDDRTGMDDYAIAQPAAVANDGVGPDERVLSHAHRRTQVGTRVHDRARSDGDVLIDNGERTHTHAFPESGRRVDRSERVHT